MDGVVVIDKPGGLTSHDVVATIRRQLPKGTKVGHTGTLDPFATGVLPIVVGKATRLARFLSSDDKRYRAVVAFGQATTTYDRTGTATEVAPADAVQALSAETIAEALRRYVGTFSQTPPVFSAKKHEGVRAYERARAGDLTPPAPVEVTAHALTLLTWQPETGHATLDVHCGAGFYVRSLAHDLGAALGVPAHLDALRRTAAGPFVEADALALDAVVGDGTTRLPEAVRAMQTLLTHLPAVTITADEARAIAHGQTLAVGPGRLTLPPPADDVDGRVRLLNQAGHLVALATRLPDGDAQATVRLHPDIVLG